MFKGKTILIAGHVMGSPFVEAAMLRALKKKGDVNIIHVDNAGENLLTKEYLEKNLQAQSLQLELPEIKRPAFKAEALPSWPGGKKFKCNGKHRYENKGGQWLCACGRNMND